MKKIILILLLFVGLKSYSQCDTLTTYTVTNITGTSAKITWPVTPDINYYEIFAYDITNDTTLIYSSTNYPSNTITLTGLNPNRLYWCYIMFVCNTVPFINPLWANHYAVFNTTNNQVVYTPMTAAGYQFKYLKADSMFHVSNTDTMLNRATTRPGAIVCRPQDSLFYGWNGAKWAVMGADVSSLVSLINQKVDSVIVNGDSLFYWVNGVSYGQLLTVGTTNLYNSDGVLTGDRYMDQDGRKLLLDNGFYGTNVGNIRLGSDYGVLSFGEPLSYESPSEIQAQTELSIHVNGGLLFNVKDSIKTLVRFPQSSLSTDSLLVLSSTGVFKTRAQSAISGLITASNGLTKVVNDIQLGGTLTDDVSIAAANNQFEIDNASAITFQTNGTGEPIQLVQAAPFNSISIQDSLVLKPYLGIISIDTVKYAVSPYNTMLVWDSLRHNVSHVNIPTGTVTSVSAGYGMNFTTITSTGSVIADTSILVNKTGVQTLSNKRITPRVTTIASSSTPTPDIDASDVFTVTALAANATFAAPTGTPVNGQQLLIRILDNGTARTLAWNAVYRASTDFALPTTTVLSKTMYLQFIYNSASSTYDAVGYTNGF